MIELKPGKFTFHIDDETGVVSVGPGDDKATATPTVVPALDYTKLDRFLKVTEEVVTNEAGAKQTRVPYGLQYMPPCAVLETSKVMHEGTAKYGKGNWRAIPVDEHLNHAVGHIFQWWLGRRLDGPVAELSHASCRILFALELAIIEASGAALPVEAQS
jgi:hypothetical protein